MARHHDNGQQERDDSANNRIDGDGQDSLSDGLPAWLARLEPPACKCPKPRKHVCPNAPGPRHRHDESKRCGDDDECACCLGTCKCPYDTRHVCPCDGNGGEACPDHPKKCRCQKGKCQCPPSWRSAPCWHVRTLPDHGMSLEEWAIELREASPKAYQASALPFRPTCDKAGSEDKIRLMMLRVAEGASCFHPRDSREVEPMTLSEDEQVLFYALQTMSDVERSVSVATANLAWLAWRCLSAETGNRLPVPEANAMAGERALLIWSVGQLRLEAEVLHGEEVELYYRHADRGAVWMESWIVNEPLLPEIVDKLEALCEEVTS